MDEINIKKENYGKFIFNGSLAVECYDDYDASYEDQYFSYNEKLGNYRKLSNKTDEDTEKIVNELKKLIKTMGIEHFNFYDDGSVECNVKFKERNK